MNNYIVIFIGWVIGQVIHACRESWKLQHRDVSLSWPTAMKYYITKGQGSFFFGISILFGVLFVFPDVISDTAAETAKWKFWIIKYLRIASVAFGFFCQGAGFLLFGMGDKLIQLKAGKEGIDIKPE